MLLLLPSLLVALLHIYILILESFLWTHPLGHRTFRLTPQFAQQTRSLAANQGLYNGFLAAGIIWGVFHPHSGFGKQVIAWHLGCVVVAGVVGAWTTGKTRIAKVQCGPALVAGVALWWA